MAPIRPLRQAPTHGSGVNEYKHRAANSKSLRENVERRIRGTVEHITTQQVYTLNSSEALPRRHPLGRRQRLRRRYQTKLARPTRYSRAGPRPTRRGGRWSEGSTPSEACRCCGGKGRGRRYRGSAWAKDTSLGREWRAGRAGTRKSLVQNPSPLPRSKTTSAGTSFAHMATPRLGPWEWRSGLWTASTPLQAAQRAKRSKRGFATNSTLSLAATTSFCRGTGKMVDT